MKANIKKITALFLALGIILSVFCIPEFSVSANAAQRLTLQELQAKFPDGKYWNHAGRTGSGHRYRNETHYGNCGDVLNTITSTPCTGHGTSAATCNCYKDRVQCVGFATYLGYLSSGSDPKTNWKMTKYTSWSAAIAKVKPGDVIKYEGAGAGGMHWVFVYQVTSSTVKVAECNWGTGATYRCRICWGRNMKTNSGAKAIELYSAPSELLTHKHSFTDHVCECGEWDKTSATETACAILMRTTYDTADSHIGPYTKSSKKTTLKKDTEVYAVAKVKNAFGNNWYRLSDGSYIYYDCVKKYSPQYSMLVFDICRLKNKATGEYLVVSQSKDEEGHNVGTWDKSNETGMIFAINLSKDIFGYSIRPQCSETRVLTANSSPVTTATDINIKTKTDGDNQTWRFQSYSDGFIIRSAANESCVLAGNGSHKSVILQNFTGQNNQIWIKESTTGHVHNYAAETVTKKATCTQDGTKELKCACGETITQVIPAAGHDYVESIIPATCTENAYKTVKCSVCGEVTTQKLEGGATYGEWSFTKPAAGEIETKTVYRYKGAGSEPVKKEEGSIDFACFNGKMTGPSFPAGFNTSSPLYSQYNKTPRTAASDEKGKTEVEYKPIGYIYWHWCYGTYTAGPINRKISSKKTDTFKSFHAFFSNRDIALTASANARKNENGAVCKDTYWWLDERVPVYRCTYTVYEYGSDWSDTPPAADGSREIESAPMYRTVQRDKYAPAGHKWDGGRITTAATQTKTGVKTFTCTVCGQTKTETVPQTSGGFTPGDVDDSGDITVTDARLCLRRAILLEMYKPDSREFLACDVDRDAGVSVSDARSILRVAIRLDSAEDWNKKG